MVEKLIVNGIEVDLNSESGLSLCFKSNILEKTSDFSSCYSYTYDLPMTITNKAVFGELLSVGNKNKRVRQFLDTEYYRDGFKIFRGSCYVTDIKNTKFSIVCLFGVNNALQQIKEDGLLINELFNSPKDENVRNYTAEELLAYKRYIPLTSKGEFAHYPFNSDSATDTQLFALHDSTTETATLTGSKLAVRAKRIFDLLEERYGLEVESSINTRNYWIQTAQNNRKDKFRLDFWRHGLWSTHLENEVILYPLLPDSESNMNNLIYGIDYEMTEGNVVTSIKHKYRLERVQLTMDVVSPSPGTVVYTNVAKQSQLIGTRITPQNTLAKWSLSNTHIELDFKPSELGLEYEFDATNTSIRESVYNCSAITLISDAENVTPVPQNVQCLMTFSLMGENVASGYINSIDSLPSVTITQFLQDFFFGCFGGFIVNTLKDTNKIKVVNLEEIISNTPYDWSHKIIGDEIKENNHLEGTAKKNFIKWNASQVEAKNFISFNTADETLEEEDVFFTSNFGKLEGLSNYTYYGGASIIPSAKILSLYFGHALRIDDSLYAVVRNANFDWIDNDLTSAVILKKTLGQPLQLECDVVFSSAELAGLDMTRPVIFSQFGGLFVIKEMTITGEKGKLKLIQIKI